MTIGTRHHRLRLNWALLVSLLVVVELLAIGARGTLASDSSQTENSGNTASAGTLTLETTSGSTICQSSGGNVGTAFANHNTSCGTITITTTPLYPGQSATTSIRIENSGSVNAGELSVYAPKCTPTTGTSLCTALEFYIQQTTANACYYPVTTTTCSFASYTQGGTGTLASFRGRYGATSRLILRGGLAALSSRTFTLGFELPSFANPSAGNPYQGLTAKLTLTWYLTITSPVT